MENNFGILIKNIKLQYFLSLRFKKWCEYLDLDCQNVPPVSMICDLHFKDDQFNNSKKTKTIRPSIKIFCVAGAIINSFYTQ